MRNLEFVKFEILTLDMLNLRSLTDIPVEVAGRQVNIRAYSSVEVM